MRKIKLLFIIIICFVLFVPGAEILAYEIRGGDQISIAKDEVINDDLFIGGNFVSVDGTINGDLICAVSNAVVNGTIKGDLIVAGGTVILKGSIGDDLIVAGGNIIVDTNIKDNAIMAGGGINVGEEAKIGRDLLLGAGQAVLAGEVKRNLKTSSKTLTVQGKIGGDLKGRFDQELVVTSSAEIKGNLDYKAPSEAKLEEGAKILGETKWERLEKARVLPRLISTWKIFDGLGLIILGLIMAFFLPNQIKKVLSIFNQSPVKSFGWGLVLFFVIPLVSLVALFTLVGIPLAIVLLCLYLASLILSKTLVGIWLGTKVISCFRKEVSFILGAVLGCLILAVLMIVPYFGFLIKLTAIIFGLGAIILRLKSIKS